MMDNTKTVAVRWYDLPIQRPFLYSTGDEHDATLEVDDATAERWTQAWDSFKRMQIEIDDILRSRAGILSA